MLSRTQRDRRLQLILQVLRHLCAVNPEFHALGNPVKSIASRFKGEFTRYCFSTLGSANIYAEFVRGRRITVWRRIIIQQYLRAASAVPKP